MAQNLTIRYEWLNDQNPQLDLRHLGNSLLGIERIVSVGLYALERGGFPKGRRSVPHLLRVTAARPGSLEFDISFLGYLAALFYASIRDDPSSFLKEWIMSVMNRAAGRNDRAMDLLEKAMDRLFDLADRQQSIIQQFGMRDWQNMADSARAVAAPVGESCSKIVFDDNSTGEDEIDLSLAEEIRGQSGTHTGHIEPMRLRVDGFWHQNQHLKVVDPDDPSRLITARVLDPEFNVDPNVYIAAAMNRSSLDVSAKVIRKDGKIVMLYIMDARPVSRRR